MEKFNKEKYPECVKCLLTAAGFDSQLSLKDITEAKLASAEQFLTKNRHLINDLECCYSEQYKEMADFQFLPGHKSLIMSIPSRLLEWTKTVQKWSKNQNLKQDDPGRIEFHQMYGQYVSASKRKTCRSAEEIKLQLIHNLRMFLGKVGPQFPVNTITDANLHDFSLDPTEFDDIVYRCQFVCPFCNKPTPVTFKKHWMSSNATSHLKWHAKKGWDFVGRHYRRPIVDYEENSDLE